MKKTGLPKVAIVGRMNVGKSTLFNRLSENVKSLTLDYEGVTRDVIVDVVCWKDRCFELIDTGGISFKKTQDPIMEETRKRALAMLEESAVILFVVDGKSGIMAVDTDIAKMLHKLNKTTILIINKIDSKQAEERVHEFARFGFKHSVALSAQHGLGIPDLFEAVLELLPPDATVFEEEKPLCNVVILGKPNVGKSSLLNLLLNEERAIVADIPGTTRESISERIAFNKSTIQVTDTPGIRRKRGVTETLEQLMVKSSLSAVEDADVILLMLDASQGKIVDQELKLAFYVFEQKHKGLILLLNKDDLMDEEKKADLKFSLEPYDYFLDKIVQLRISCKDRKNIRKLTDVINEVCERYKQRFSDDDLTRLFKEALVHKPLYKNGVRLVVYRAKQVKFGPITIELVVNYAPSFGPSQLSYFEGVLRKHVDLKGVPVRLVTRTKK